MRGSLSLTFLLIVVLLLLFTITVKGQSIDTAKVTLGLKDESLEKAIKKIEQQSAFRFFYRDAYVSQLTHLNLTPGIYTIKQTLDSLLQNAPLSFRQINSNILLEHKDQQVYYEVKGKVVNGFEKSPAANVSVFLSNTTIGDKTANDGTFTLQNIKPGKYNLVVSFVGFETYSREIEVNHSNIILPDNAISPKLLSLTKLLFIQGPR